MSKKKNWNKPVNVMLSAGLVASVVVPVYPITANAETVASDLIISEYIEGGSFNKAIELYNGTGQAVDLSNYTLELYANGASTASNKLTLSGTLDHGETYILYHRDAAQEIKNKGDFENMTVINFSGDDALVLRNGSEVIDSFGQVGARSNWGQDVTLVRKSSITTGDSIADDAFNRDDEWITFPKDTFDHLGSHEMDGTTPGEPGDPDPDPGDPGDPGETIDVSTIADARNMAVGQTVKIKGIVAANLKNTISVQDATGGIAVRPTSLNAKIGDEVTLTGTLADYRGLLQLDGATIIEKAEDVGAPAPKVVTGADISENTESQLVTVRNVELTDVATGSGWANYTANDGNEFLVRDETATLGLEVGTTYETITGIVQQFDNDYQVIPRSTSDVVIDSSIIQPVVANPGSGTFIGGTTVTLTTSTIDAEILYTLDGSDPIENGSTYATPIKVNEDTTIKAVVEKAGKYSDVVTFTYVITDSLQIHDIQGGRHTSPFENQTVEGIEGIVTYKYELNGSTYYHIQTPDDKRDGNPNTSEAIVLYSGRDAWKLSVGDLISVTGKVSEYAIDGYDDRQTTDLKTTQINVRDDQGGLVKILERNVPLPTPFIINEDNLPQHEIASHQLAEFDPTRYAADFWESREAMLVQVGNVKAVAPQEHGDLVTVLENTKTETLHGGILYNDGDPNAERVQFRLEPNGTARDFEVATGDQFKGPITGVVGYSFQNYKIYTSLDDMKKAHLKGDAKPETTTIVKADDKLTIASYNLENFSNNTKTTTADKAKKLARAFASDMQNPDIIGVTEVQDNNGPDAGDSKANQSYERLIKAIKDAGGVEYKYVNIDPVNNADGGQPNANIRVGFLYNPNRVKLTDGTPGTATQSVGYQDGKLTLNPGRIDPNNSAFTSSRKPLAAQFEFQGESVIVIANHWNSKTGDTPLFGQQQPPVYSSEVQRKKIAQIVYNFVADVKTKNPDANIVSLGDFNDYQFTEALRIHEGEHMKNMINTVKDSDRYTYVYQGNSQVLDHILVSNNLANQTEIDILHINADFTDMAGRASDHDPVMVQIDLTKGEIEAPIEAEKTYKFTGYKTNKLVINKPSVAVAIDGTSVIPGGVAFTGAYGLFTGEGLANLAITINPADAGAVIDFAGHEVKNLIIDGVNVKEVRGAENIGDIEFINGADPSKIKFTNSKGEPIAVPSFPGENQAPKVIKQIQNYNVAVGEVITIALNEYFSDPENDPLTFTATKGEMEGNILKLQLEKGSHIVGVTASDGNKTATISFAVTVAAENNPTDDYYKTAIGKEGQTLKTALHEIISDHKKLSYSQVWDALKETDEDPNNKSNVILLYSNESRSKDRNGGNVGDWNREHVWAKSHGDFGTSIGPGTDIHHLRPTDVQVNSARGNLDFDNGGSAVNGCKGCYKTTNSWEPPDRVKGDVARMLFYMATRYEQGDRVDLELNEKLNNGKNPYHGKLSVLLDWHKQDPVDEFERNRNEKIFGIQGNRNPFIDHPEWVESIWKQGGFAAYLKAS